ncbi:hypothetical protein AXG93_1478s1050 [Marchantia polymorpha subsp. ruderalis]|uniref:Uncharacterized protein n=1 Tax=Marchantia polymorpha subsp. ruderalis TaxID=1480154 RepID=A0A176VMK0_MARPO|nr:hypothetical protein AXG93_1478s1050 [Marchantia polymorpha subsp. ruderalis]
MELETETNEQACQLGQLNSGVRDEIMPEFKLNWEVPEDAMVSVDLKQTSVAWEEEFSTKDRFKLLEVEGELESSILLGLAEVTGAIGIQFSGYIGVIVCEQGLTECENRRKAEVSLKASLKTGLPSSIVDILSAVKLYPVQGTTLRTLSSVVVTAIEKELEKLADLTQLLTLTCEELEKKARKETKNSAAGLKEHLKTLKFSKRKHARSLKDEVSKPNHQSETGINREHKFETYEVKQALRDMPAERAGGDDLKLHEENSAAAVKRSTSSPPKSKTSRTPGPLDLSTREQARQRDKHRQNRRQDRGSEIQRQKKRFRTMQELVVFELSGTTEGESEEVCLEFDEQRSDRSPKAKTLLIELTISEIVMQSFSFVVHNQAFGISR